MPVFPFNNDIEHGTMDDLAAAVDACLFSNLTSTEQWAISLPRLMPVFSHLINFSEHGTMGDLAAAVDARFFFLFLLFSLSFFCFEAISHLKGATSSKWRGGKKSLIEKKYHLETILI